MGCRGPNLILLVRSVDVDIAVIGVGVLFLKAMKAEDAGEDEILFPGGLVGAPLGHRFSSLENCVKAFTGTVFFAYLESPERCLEALSLGPKSEFGSGDGVALKQPLLSPDFDCLGGNRDAEMEGGHSFRCSYFGEGERGRAGLGHGAGVERAAGFASSPSLLSSARSLWTAGWVAVRSLSP